MGWSKNKQQLFHGDMVQLSVVLQAGSAKVTKKERFNPNPGSTNKFRRFVPIPFLPIVFELSSEELIPNTVILREELCLKMGQLCANTQQLDYFAYSTNVIVLRV